MSFSVGRRRHTTRSLRVCGRNELTQEINGSVINQSGSSNVHPPLVAELVSSVAGQDARALPSDSVYLGKLCAFGNSDRPHFLMTYQSALIECLGIECCWLNHGFSHSARALIGINSNLTHQAASSPIDAPRDDDHGRAEP